MSYTGSGQSCVVCAWRERCAKKFCVTDGGARCPDFSRDISIKDVPGTDQENDKGGKS